MILVAPSILSANFSFLGEDIRQVESAGADWLHVDVMDGHFVPNLTIGPQVVADIRKVTGLFLDVHLMIEKPDQLIPAFAQAGAQLITVHWEACPHLHRVVTMIKELQAMICLLQRLCHLQVDGGINQESGLAVIEAGCDVLVAGSYVFGAADRRAAVQQLKRLGSAG